MEKLERKLKTVNIKGKEYVEVKERILALVDNGEPYSIETEYQYFSERKMWVVKAKLTMIATGEIFNGTAQEIESDNYKEVNSTSALENAETSAVGRACAFAGIGVIDGIASADEVKKAINRGNETSNISTKENWLNYDDLVAITDAGNTTRDQIEIIIKQDGYKLSKMAGEAISHYLKTGEIDKNLFFKK